MPSGKRNFITNVFYLALVQGCEYVVPLLAIPFLLRKIGIAAYGEIAFIQAASMYCLVFTEFGFNFTATRHASINRENTQELSRLFWNVQSAKVTLWLISGCVLFNLGIFVQKFHEIGAMFLCALLPALGSTMYPLWVLQGTERMREAAAIMIVARLSMLGLILILVRSPADIMIAALCQMGALPLAGALSWAVIIRTRLVGWARPSVGGILQILGDSRHTFLAVASGTLYRQTNALVLGFVSGPVAVAHYGIVERIVKAAQELTRPLAQAAYPRITSTAARSRHAAMPMLRRLLLATGGVNLVISLTLLFGMQPILAIVGGNALQSAKGVMVIMAFVPLTGGINTVLGIQTMMAFNFSRAFSRMVAASGLFNLVAVVPLALRFGERGAAISYVMSETMLLLSMSLFLHRKGINLLTGTMRHA